MDFSKLLTLTVGGIIAGGAYFFGNQQGEKNGQRQGHEEGFKEGAKTANAETTKKYEQKMQEMTKRFNSYHDFENSVMAMYSLGLALADEDRSFWNEHLENLEIITGLSSNKLPQHIQDAIVSLKHNPPSWNDALIAAKKVKLPKSDIDDIVDIIAFVRGYANSEITSIWELSSKEYHFEVGV